eukprot:gb/GECG01005006.1/.p1 GENE.gb/GECG01005006.1/~~gb/GECG01005006.1/.p1  ORF type:complete len:337 (+),score=60.51 gb/GECG01005006.1/:1-1011(+)
MSSSSSSSQGKSVGFEGQAQPTQQTRASAKGGKYGQSDSAGAEEAAVANQDTHPEEEEEDVDMQGNQAEGIQPESSQAQASANGDEGGDAEGQSTNVRAPSRSVYVPIVYGTMSWWLGRPGPGSDKEHSHRWKAYVRGADGRDISYAVRAVVFKLHPSFANPDREVTSPPFELNETGWGEFDLHIKIFFHDLNAKPITRKHTLRLYHNGGQISKEAPVVSENYDEIVFNDLHKFNPQIREQLLRGPQKQEEEHEGAEYHQEFSPDDDLRGIAQAHAFITAETERLRERLARADAEAEALSVDIMQLGGSPTDYLSDVVTHRMASQVAESIARQETG